MRYALLLLILLTGCVSTHVDMKIDSDGMADVNLTYDYSAMAEMMEARNVSEDMCEDMTFDWEDFGCTQDGLILTVSGRLPVPGFESSQGLFKSTYRYDVERTFETFNPQGSSSFDSSSISSDGASATLRLEMPGTITNKGAEGNVIIVDLLEPEHKFVTSEEREVLQYVLLGSGVLVLLIFFSIVFSHFKKRVPKPQQLVSPDKLLQEGIASMKTGDVATARERYREYYEAYQRMTPQEQQQHYQDLTDFYNQVNA